MFAGWDPVTGKRIDVHGTVKAPDTRAGAKLADARLAEMISAVESGQPTPERKRTADGAMTVQEIAERWETTDARRLTSPADPRSRRPWSMHLAGGQLGETRRLALVACVAKDRSATKAAHRHHRSIALVVASASASGPGP